MIRPLQPRDLQQLSPLWAASHSGAEPSLGATGSFQWQPTEKTLTDEEIEKVGVAIVGAVTKATGGALRG